jgi:hypothetical protein
MFSTQAEVKHPYKTDLMAHQAFEAKLHERVRDALEQSEQAFTDQERLCWQALADSLQMCERWLAWDGDADSVDLEATRKKRKELNEGMLNPLVKRFDTMRTTDEREIVIARVDGMNEALSLHSHHTGIY